MNQKILLLEPNYQNKYPPIGLMKISYFHKYILHDYVKFAKGELPPEFCYIKWDRVYVTSLFTFEWEKTIAAIKYAQMLVGNDKIIVGGIAATLLSSKVFQATGIFPVCGLLNKAGKIGLPNDECIDQLIPDYDILNDIAEQYIYPHHDAYFLSATKGCGMKCGFCAVQTLEPHYVAYIDIKSRIKEIDIKYGPKKDLLLMDNNVLRSENFKKIIQDIIDAGFHRGATYMNAKTGKRIQRVVDFNQGLDANFINDDKAKLLGMIALKPARIAFDHIEDKTKYEHAIRTCVRNNVRTLSNYILYNSEDFNGKGKKYHADTPQDLYDRMRISLDLKDELSDTFEPKEKVAIFSFPMRYIPLTDTKRGYVGSQWNAKFLRAVQCMLIPTQGKGVGNRSFFEADFGKDSSEFIKFLCMPERLIASRGIFSAKSRGHSNDTEDQTALRLSSWKLGQTMLQEWTRLFDLLSSNINDFISIISNNEFLPEHFGGLKSSLHKKLYLHYLTIPRMFKLLEITFSTTDQELLKTYIFNEFTVIYHELIKYLATSKTQKVEAFKSFVDFFGKQGIDDLLTKIKSLPHFVIYKPMGKWNSVLSTLQHEGYEFDLIRIYFLFTELNILSSTFSRSAYKAITQKKMYALRDILQKHFVSFVSKFYALEDEQQRNILGGKSSEKQLGEIQEKIFPSK